MAADVTPVVGATASAVAPLLMGPVLEGTVLGAFSQAVIVGLRTESGPRVVSLLARGAAAVPNGMSSGGLPISLQIVCRGYEEAMALRIGYAWQQAHDWHMQVPPMV